MCRIVEGIARRLSQASAAEHGPDISLQRLEHVMSLLARMTDVETQVNYEPVMRLLQRARQILQDLRDISHQERNPIQTFTGTAGRPSFEIPEAQILFLVEQGFSSTDMGIMMGVSSRTIRRRMQQYGVSIRESYSTMSDAALDIIVLQILTEFSNCGYRRMDGFLRSRGHRIQHQRIRQSIARVDPDGVILRSLEIHVVRRRAYNVIAPLALWHIDGYHKLIR